MLLIWSQDEMEAADGGGFGAAGRSGQLLGAAANVSVTIFLPAGAPRLCGRNSGGGGGSSGDVQQCVSEQCAGAASRSHSTQTACATRANSRPGHGRPTSAQPAGESCSWHAASSVKKNNKTTSEEINENRHWRARTASDWKRLIFVKDT